MGMLILVAIVILFDIAPWSFGLDPRDGRDWRVGHDQDQRSEDL